MGFDASASESDFASVFLRAELLLDQGRPADAAEWFQKAVALNPDSDAAHAKLALSWIHHEATYARAQNAARRAAELDPESSFNHGVLAIVLLNSSKPGQHQPEKEAQTCADRAVELDPESSFAHGIRALAFLRRGRHREAELPARKALELNPDNTTAAQALTVVLAHLGKKEDLRSLVEWQLQEHPNDDAAHVSAGFQALHDGRVKEANLHFQQALRIDPSNEAARQGLLDSFRARSFFYRWYLQFSQFMRTTAGDKAQWVLLGGYVVYRLTRETLQKSHPGLAGLLGAVWLTFALWSFFARGLGSLLMLTDPFARAAVRASERWEGICVGGAVLGAFALFSGAVLAGSKDGIDAAGVLALGAVPAACAFANDHVTWKRVFTAAAAIAGVMALAHTAGFLWGVDSPLLDAAGLGAVLIGVAATWIAMLSGFRL